MLREGAYVSGCPMKLALLSEKGDVTPQEFFAIEVVSRLQAA